MTTLRRIDTHAGLVAATDGDPFVRYDLPDPLDHPAYQFGDAVATLRHTHTRALGLLVMGSPQVAAELVRVLVAEGIVAPTLGRVTATRGSLEAIAAHLPVGDRSDWEWMYAGTPPPVVRGEDRLVPLGEDDRERLDAFLSAHNDRTDARPFQTPDQHWVAVLDAAGALVACGVREPGISGYPVLAGITVRPDHRGSGLGLAVTAYLTREAIADRGVSLLGLYSDNAAARRLYHGLGYAGDHLWSSHRPHG